MITSFHLKWRTRKLSRCVKCVLSAHVNLQIMKFGSAEAENSLSLDRATDDCQPVPSLSPPLRVNEWATKILPSSVLRISSATYLTVKSLYLSERIPQRYKFTLPRSAARSLGGAVLKANYKEILIRRLTKGDQGPVVGWMGGPGVPKSMAAEVLGSCDVGGPL